MKKKPAPKRTTARPDRMTKGDLKKFGQMLFDLRDRLTGNISRLEDQALRTPAEVAGGQSSAPIHMADVASDNYEQEFTLGLMGTAQEELHAICEALNRIRDGSYGVCEDCSKPIPRARLEAKPCARLCVPCREKEEERSES